MAALAWTLPHIPPSRAGPAAGPPSPRAMASAGSVVAGPSPGCPAARGGGQAELAVVHERLAMPVPAGVAWDEAGGFPEVFTTAHDALFTQCGLGMGEALLVHGAAGGVGTAAVQLGVAAGALVTGTVRNLHARQSVEALGATAVPHDDFAGGGPYDVILELVGAVNLESNFACL